MHLNVLVTKLVKKMRSTKMNNKFVFEFINLIEKDSNEKAHLSEICYDTAIKSNLPISKEYIDNHINLDNSKILFAKDKNNVIAVYLIHLLNINSKKLLFISLASVDNNIHGSGVSRKASEAILKNTIPDYFVGRTGNPLAYYASAKIADKIGVIYPDFTSPVPKEIMNIAKQLPSFINRDGVHINNDLILKDFYDPDFAEGYLKQKLNGEDKRTKLINEKFLNSSFEKRDAQILIIKLKTHIKLIMKLLKFFT